MSAMEAEAALASLLMAHARAEPWEHRHPMVALQAVSLLRRLPVLVYQPSDSGQGQAIRRNLQRSTFGVTTPLHEATTLLELPQHPDRYDEGHGRATLRRHSRKALRAGVSWTRVDNAAERERLVAIAYQNARARFGDDLYEEFDFSYLLDCDLWLIAWHQELPILLSVTAVDGEWALLGYFCSLAFSPIASATRYLMTGVLADHLAGRGVR